MINALFAVDPYGGMGLNGTMPWPHNSADLANFKQLTLGHVVVMGRKTWNDENMPKPLKGRITYVATSSPTLFNTATISGDLKQEVLKLEKQHPGKIIWIIGGPDILEQCRDVLDRVYLTHYKKTYKVDTKINIRQFLSGWDQVSAVADPNLDFTTVVYENFFGRTKTST